LSDEEINDIRRENLTTGGEMSDERCPKIKRRINMRTTHQLQVPADVLEEVGDMLKQVDQLLKPYVVTLSVQDRRELSKMGDKTLSFVTKAYDFAKQSPQIFPAYLNLSDFEVDLTDALKLRTLVVMTQQLTGALDDTAMAAGSEAYSAARHFYQAAKAASEQHVPGAKEIAKELRERFPNNKRRTAVAPTDATKTDA
jgi:hypothetical protein